MKTVLVIDDDKIFRLLLCEVLKVNFRIIEAEDGITGIRIAKELRPDIILCDINMPEMNGFEVLRVLRQNSTTVNIPIIFLTGNCSKQYQSLAFELGANAYLNKPINSRMLLTTITEQIS